MSDLLRESGFYDEPTCLEPAAVGHCLQQHPGLLHAWQSMLQAPEEWHLDGRRILRHDAGPVLKTYESEHEACADFIVHYIARMVAMMEERSRQRAWMLNYPTADSRIVADLKRQTPSPAACTWAQGVLAAPPPG